ncbi:hypothetical protein XdyCFBP7245_09855 [Xanthomonas dyei]|uniref:Uncharacterized protein n=1 Tax=Xanthomonas dyei TaxID=743699 RepID=A0A2S7C4D5_9XANT|nr:hypothetical protein XdyCFBP7245_09855 [Xanthomonas dyei]
MMGSAQALRYRLRADSGEGVLLAAIELLLPTTQQAVPCRVQAWRARPRIVALVLLRPAARQNALAHGL